MRGSLLDRALHRTVGVHDECAPNAPIDWVPPVGLTLRETGRLNRAMWKLERHTFEHHDFVRLHL